MSDSIVPQSPSDFDYSGYLLFEPYQTSVRDRLDVKNIEEAEQSLTKLLPEFEQGTPQDPGDGFRQLSLRQLAAEAGMLNKYAELNKTGALRYINESFEKSKAYHQGELIEAQTIHRESNEIYWNYPDFLFLRGSKKQRENSLRRLRSLLVDSLYLEQISFEPEFLLWVLYMYYLGEELELGEVQRVHDVVHSGEIDNLGSSINIADSTDVLSSLPVIHGILHDQDISEIEGIFNRGNLPLRVRISEDSIHLKISDGVLSDRSSFERILISIDFVTNLCKTYMNWSSLSPEDRYPPPAFFEDIYEQAMERGIEVDSVPSSVIEKYRELRQGSPDGNDRI